MTRRDDREYREYLREEQRGQRGCIAGRMQLEFHHGLLNIMTMGWHMMLGFSPALFGYYIWEENHSYQMLRRSKECVQTSTNSNGLA